MPMGKVVHHKFCFVLVLSSAAGTIAFIMHGFLTRRPDYTAMARLFGVSAAILSRALVDGGD